jgi:hypothetical protein
MLAHKIFAKQFGSAQLTEADLAVNDSPLQVRQKSLVYIYKRDLYYLEMSSSP